MAYYECNTGSAKLKTGTVSGHNKQVTITTGLSEVNLFIIYGANYWITMMAITAPFSSKFPMGRYIGLCMQSKGESNAYNDNGHEVGSAAATADGNFYRPTSNNNGSIVLYLPTSNRYANMTSRWIAYGS